MSQKERKTSIIRQGFWSTSTTGITLGLQVLEVVLLSRLIPKELLGAYFLITAFPEMVRGVLDLRLHELMTKYLIRFIHAGETEKANALLKGTWLLSVSIGILIFVAVAVLSTLSTHFLDAHEHRNLMLLFAFGLFVDSLQGRSGSILRALGRFDINFWIAAVIGVIRLSSIAYAAFGGYGLAGLIVARFITQVSATVLTSVTAYNLLKRTIPLTFKAPLRLLEPIWRELAHFVFHLNLSAMAKGISDKIDVVLIGSLLNPAAVAAYKVVGQLGKLVYLLSDGITSTVYTRFVELTTTKSRSHLNKLALSCSAVVCASVLVIFVLFLFFHRPIVEAFAGPQYAQYSWLLPIFLLSNCAAVVFFWTHPYLLSIGFPQYASVSNLVGRLGGILLFACLLTFFSLPGAAASSGAGGTLTVAISLILILRRNSRDKKQESAEKEAGIETPALRMGPVPSSQS